MDIKYMKMALEEAKKAYKENEIPIGAVIVRNNMVLARTHNKKNQTNKVMNHAEILAIDKASEHISNWRLENCDIYITLEPCPMCMSAIQQSRIENVYFGINNSDEKNKEIIKSIAKSTKTNASVNLYNGYLSDEIRDLMNSFFQNKRK